MQYLYRVQKVSFLTRFPTEGCRSCKRHIWLFLASWHLQILLVPYKQLFHFVCQQLSVLQPVASILPDQSHISKQQILCHLCEVILNNSRTLLALLSFNNQHNGRPIHVRIKKRTRVSTSLTIKSSDLCTVNRRQTYLCTYLPHVRMISNFCLNYICKCSVCLL